MPGGTERLIMTLGLGLALLATRGLSNFLFGVNSFDLSIFAAVTGMLLGAALLASFVPALEDLLVQEDSERYSFIQQFTRMARVRGALANEDRLEAVSMAVAYFVDRMNRDTHEELQKAKDEALDDELVKFM